MNGPRLDAPAADEVHVWRAHLVCDARALTALRTIISDQELARASRFRFARDGDRFVVARARLRQVLASYLGVAAQSVPLTEEGSGRPRLAGSAGWLHFSVAHSVDLALFAIGRSRELGVDVERERDGLPMDAIARKFFTAEGHAAYAGVAPDDRRRAFFEQWTRYEAWLKAAGGGLSHPPPATSGWSVRTLHAADGYAAAVAVRGDARIPAAATPVDTLLTACC